MTGPGRRRGRAPVLGALVAVLGLALASLAGCDRTEPSPPMSSGRWAIDWQDGFSSGRLDGRRWATCYWWDQGSGCTNLGNGEAQWYVPGQVSVADGVLRLTARPQRSTHLGRTFTYASGMVSSGRIGNTPEDAARYAFTYGYVEVRFRTPEGGGLWPAIWMLPVTNQSLPEIDLLEQYGDRTTRASMTLHTVGQRDRTYVDGPDLATGWHTVGLEWTKGRLRWFLDGVQRYEVRGDRVPSEPMYLLVDLAVGGNAGTPPASTSFPATFLVDRVTVWRQT